MDKRSLLLSTHFSMQLVSLYPESSNSTRNSIRRWNELDEGLQTATIAMEINVYAEKKETMGGRQPGMGH